MVICSIEIFQALWRASVLRLYGELQSCILDLYLMMRIEDYKDEVDLPQYYVVIQVLAWNSCSHRPAAQPEDHAKVGAVHCSRRREPTDGSGRVVTCSVAPVAPCSARQLSAAPRLHHREFPELSARGATAAAALPRNSTAHYTAQTPRSEQGKQTAHLAVYSDLS